MHKITAELEQRILLLDGALGTMVQQYKLEEKDYRHAPLENHTIALKGNTDLLNLSRSDVIQEIHRQYLEAGADIIATNTFGGNAISQADYDTAAFVVDINQAGARLAREVAEKMTRDNPVKPRFVAGAMGPTTQMASLSPRVNDPGFRAVNFDQLVTAFAEQARALLAGGVDLFLLETITDTLNAKAALFALMQVFEETGQSYPIMVSGTITDASGRILSGQTVEAFLISISHVPLLSVGLNCALGAAELRPYLQELHKKCPFYVSTHPNAGLPNPMGEYDQTAEEFAAFVQEFAQKGWLNIVGGCCGTTPLHIAAAAKAIQGISPRQKPGFKHANNEKVVTDEQTQVLIEAWYQQESYDSIPSFSLKELMEIVSKVEDEKTFLKLKAKFDKEKPLYHPEQALLLNAHIFGRYQYLREESRL